MPSSKNYGSDRSSSSGGPLHSQGKTDTPSPDTPGKAQEPSRIPGQLDGDSTVTLADAADGPWNRSVPFGGQSDTDPMGVNQQYVGPASLDRAPGLVPTYTDRPTSRILRPRRLGALFVDFENIYLSFSDLVTKPLEATIHVLTVLRDELELQHEINVVLGRAYGSWEYGPARDALSQLSLLGIVPQYVLSRRHKSSADLKLSIDLMEVLLTRADIECYIIVGGDRDYMPIVEKIKERAKDILIIGPAQATSGDLIALVGMENFIDATSLFPPDAEPLQVGGSPKVITTVAEQQSVMPILESSPPKENLDEDREEGGEAIPQSPAEEETSSSKDTGKPRIPQTVHVDPKDEIEADKILRQFMHEYAIQDLWACVGLILRAQDEIRSAEIWIGPFLKNYMNDAFDFMNNAQRKRLLKIMEEVGAVTVTEKQDRMGEQTYSVLTVNWDSPIIKTGLVRRG